MAAFGRILAGFMLLTSCAFDPVIVHNSSIRRTAGAKLWTCLKANPADDRPCRAEVDAYCQANGLEKGCGNDDAWALYFSTKR